MDNQRYLKVDLHRAELNELQKARDLLIKTIDRRISNIQKLVDRKEEEIEELKMAPATTYPFELYLEKDNTRFAIIIKNNLDKVIFLSGIPAMQTEMDIFDSLINFGEIEDVKKISPHHAIVHFSLANEAKKCLARFSQFQPQSGLTISSRICKQNSDTVIVKNIPEYLLSNSEIKNLMESFGKVERILIKEEENWVYVVFADKMVANQLVNNPYPFSKYQNRKKYIKIEASEHVMSKEELDQDIDSYMTNWKDYQDI